MGQPPRRVDGQAVSEGQPMTIEERNQLVEENIGLSYYFARIHKSIIPNIEYDDAFGIAQIALIKAAARYDPSKGAFSTYVSKAVRNEFLLELKKINAVSGIPLSKISSLQSPVGDSDLTLGDVLFDGDIADRVIDKVLFKQALSVVSERDREILILYYHASLSTREISELYGISFQRVHAIIMESLVKIRRKLGFASREFGGVQGGTYQMNYEKGTKEKRITPRLSLLEHVQNTSAAQGG